MEALLMDFSQFVEFARTEPGMAGTDPTMEMCQSKPAEIPAAGDFFANGSTGAFPSVSGTDFHGSMGNFQSSGMDDGVYLEPAPMEPAGSSEADPLKDPVFSYISDMLMDEDTDERTCMFIDCSGYKSMANELTQIISDSSSSGASESENTNKGAVDSWIHGVLNNDEVVDSDVRVEGRTMSDEEYENTVHKMMNEIQALTAASTPGGEGGGHEGGGHRKVVEEEESVNIVERDALSLQSLLRECSEFLKDAPGKDAVHDHDPWSGDLFATHDQLVAGHVRTPAVLDNDAIETEKAIRQELHGKLIECAQAVAADDVSKAYGIVNGIRDKTSPRGSGTERMVFYFAEALVARITGTGTLLYSALSSNKPAFHEMLKAYRLFTRYSPNVRISHYVCNQTILDATVGAGRVHIVDYGILYGFMWPCLIKAFSEREGGPPHLRITGIDFPQPGFKPAERVEESGRKLSEYAKQVGVPFEFHAIATTKWEGVQPSTLFLRHDEVLIVSSHFRLRHLLDESVMVDSPRKLVLSRIRSMKPKVFIQAVVNANYNAPFFISRFREALALYAAFFDAIDTAIPPEYPERLLIEQSILGREILNIVACEGQERVERAETYKQWQSRTVKAGFEQLPLRPDIYAKARAMLGTYHKSFGIGQDGNWLLIGWKETVLHAVCSWRVR
ncbi:GRAS family protein [Selaginella moellendorffii]|uniref:GRAS family protein n=1 Tax=Selaginella moellendorffii TaxID=88036 RepID=D8T5F9_SELML|nr:scarecrow-like protein 30 [Selaginella moellendorffii]XP_024520411.1 scarecrow-like protein 30 [Selaginella moellendorffii]XP_024520412.1 scarecrow-like protein 30 [Selaginella moellendorffii]EFJ08135.1 GRAS family protein [Selaginella moellendorffii]|eukprot:XP_002990862.1 scarecrow-like protein 30 [Selaginella moellendorffii]